MRSSRALCASLAAMSFAAASASAQIVPTFQSRAVSLFGSITDPAQDPTQAFINDADAAPAFDQFTSTLGPGLAWGAGSFTAEAFQDSSISATSISVAGRTRMQGFATAAGVIAQGTAISSFQVDFTVTELGLYQIDMTMSQQRAASSDLRLSYPDGTAIVELRPFLFTAFHGAMLLEPGGYSLSGTCSAAAFSDFDQNINPNFALSTFNASVALVPAPGTVLITAAGGLAACRRKR